MIYRLIAINARRNYVLIAAKWFTHTSGLAAAQGDG